MGSFANSLHVKCENAAEVARAIEALMRGEGFAPTEKWPDPHSLADLESGVRGQRVTSGRNGWVGVLDSEILGGSRLAARISEHLGTAAIWFYVHDSDSWGYHLFTGGLTIDQFDSIGDMDNGDSMDDYMPGPTDPEDESAVQAMQQEIQKRTDEIQEMMKAEMPDDIRKIFDRINRCEANSMEDRRKFGEWNSVDGRRYGEMMVQAMRQLIPNFMVNEVEAEMPALSDADCQAHLEKLRPYLMQTVSDADALGILGKQDVFAEESLGEFMELMGIPACFANLSYNYFGEFTESELKSEGLEPIAQLRFEGGQMAV